MWHILGRYVGYLSLEKYLINPIFYFFGCCQSCTGKIKALCAGVPIAVAKAILAGDDPSKIAKAAEDAINAVLGYVMPLCKDVELFEAFQGGGVGPVLLPEDNLEL